MAITSAVSVCTSSTTTGYSDNTSNNNSNDESRVDGNRDKDDIEYRALVSSDKRASSKILVVVWKGIGVWLLSLI